MRYIKKYFFGLAHCLYAFTIGLASSKSRASLSRICEYFGYGKPAVRPLIPKVPLSEIIDDKNTIVLGEINDADGNVELMELICICHLAKRVNPRTSFEIGTFDGRTTLNIAYNCAQDAKVYTLDLPKGDIDAAGLPLEQHDKKYIDKDVSGRRFLGKDEGKIIQLFGDSAKYDFSPFMGNVDFMFVDGSHSYEYVLSDSRTAAKLLRKGGVVIWHDYDTIHWEGVTRALNELYSADKAFSGCRHIEGTTLVYLFND